ncbi:MAG: aminoacyl-tRNA hydrolase [Deltaproteobacteria bacterium]|nr:aminoacyl-tRNA hydrolase [Deltaproteobacteria bacterium]
MLLVVGLGNPGKEYEKTRHNVGFRVLDQIVSGIGCCSWKSLIGARVVKLAIGSSDVLFAKPMTYMNLSGDAVGSLLHYYKLDLKDLIVVHDELDFAPGVVRIKIGGGHGGHNGLRSIITHVGKEFVRVRLGIGKPSINMAGADYVLSSFDKREQSHIDDAIALAAKAVVSIIEDGTQVAMNYFNRHDNNA